MNRLNPPNHIYDCVHKIVAAELSKIDVLRNALNNKKTHEYIRAVLEHQIKIHENKINMLTKKRKCGEMEKKRKRNSPEFIKEVLRRYNILKHTPNRIAESFMCNTLRIHNILGEHVEGYSKNFSFSVMSIPEYIEKEMENYDFNIGVS